METNNYDSRGFLIRHCLIAISVSMTRLKLLGCPSMEVSRNFHRTSSFLNLSINKGGGEEGLSATHMTTPLSKAIAGGMFGGRNQSFVQ